MRRTITTLMKRRTIRKRRIKSSSRQRRVPSLRAWRRNRVRNQTTKICQGRCSLTPPHFLSERQCFLSERQCMWISEGDSHGRERETWDQCKTGEDGENFNPGSFEIRASKYVYYVSSCMWNPGLIRDPGKFLFSSILARICYGASGMYCGDSNIRWVSLKVNALSCWKYPLHQPNPKPTR